MITSFAGPASLGRRFHRILVMGLILGLAGLPLAMPAADKAPPPERGNRAAEHLQRLAEELGLTEQQKTQVTAILKSESDQRMALRDNESMSRSEKFQAMRKIREEGRAQIRALLTPEQQKKFDAMPKPGPGRGRPGGDGPPPPPEA